MKENFIQIKDAAKILGVSKLTLRNWDKNKKLISYRHPLNNYRMYKKEDIHKLLKQIENFHPSARKNKLGDNKIYKIKVIHLKD